MDWWLDKAKWSFRLFVLICKMLVLCFMLLLCAAAMLFIAIILYSDFYNFMLGL